MAEQFILKILLKSDKRACLNLYLYIQLSLSKFYFKTFGGVVMGLRMILALSLVLSACSPSKDSDHILTSSALSTPTESTAITQYSFGEEIVKKSSVADKTFTFQRPVGSTEAADSTLILETDGSFSMVSATGCNRQLVKTTDKCLVKIRFLKSSVAGSYSATLKVGSENPLLLDLSATVLEDVVVGGNNLLTITDTSVVLDLAQTQDLGEFNGGGKITKSYTVTNKSTATTSALIVSLTQSGTAYSKTYDTCSNLALGINKNCFIKVMYQAPTGLTENQTHSASVSLTQTQGTSTLNLTAKTLGIAPPLPIVKFYDGSIDVSSLNFGVVAPNSLTYKVLTVKNLGSVVAPMVSSISGSGFLINSNSCGSSLAIGKTCSVRISFTSGAAPVSNETFSGVLSIGSGNIPLSSSLMGIPLFDKITVYDGNLETENLDYGLNAPNINVSKILKVSNEGTTTITPVITIDGNKFSIISNSCSSLAPGANCSVRIQFSSGAGSYQEEEYTGTTKVGSKNYPMVGRVQAQTPPLIKFSVDSVSVTSLNYGQITTIQAPVQKTIVISNVGGSMLNPSSAILSGDSGFTFAPSNGCLSKALLPNTSCIIKVNFASSSQGVKNSILTFADTVLSLEGQVGDAVMTYESVFGDYGSCSVTQACQGQGTKNREIVQCKEYTNGVINNESANLSFCSSDSTPSNLITSCDSPVGEKSVSVNHGSKIVSCEVGETQESFVSITCDSGFKAQGEECVEEEVTYMPEFTTWGTCSAQVCSGISGTQEREVSVCKKYVDGNFSENVSSESCSSFVSSSDLQQSCSDEGGELQLSIEHGSKIVSCAPGSNQQSVVSVSCESSYHSEQNSCLSDERSCDPMPENSIVAIQEWSHSYNDYSTCEIQECSSNSSLINNECLIHSCSPNTVSQCSVSNGLGAQTCSSDGQSNGQCVVQSCDSGFSVIGNSCVPNTLALTMNISGNGGMIKTPATAYTGMGGCGFSMCVGNFQENTIVTLTATPNYGSTFTSWSGSCSGTNPVCDVTLDAAKSVTATFSSVFNQTKGFSGGALPAGIKIDSQGRIYVGTSGGSPFFYDDQNRGRLVRLLPDGNIDTSFSTSSVAFSSNTVTPVLFLPGNKVLVIGSFTGGIKIINEDGTEDTTTYSLGTGFDSAVTDFKNLSNGSMIISGSFTSFNGVAAAGLIKLNSNFTVDSSFSVGMGFNSTINTLDVSPSGKIVVGGGFTSFNGDTSNRYLIMLNSDGSRDTSFNVGTNITSPGYGVKILSDGNILYGLGSCSAPNCLYKISSTGAINTAFAPGLSYQVSLIREMTDGTILLRSGGVRKLLPDGSADPSFASVTGSIPSVLGMDVNADGTIVSTGWFLSYNGNTNIRRIVKLSATGVVYTNFRSGSTGPMQSSTSANENFAVIADSTNKYYIGGAFTFFGGVARNLLARVLNTGSLDTAWTNPTTSIGSNNSVNALALDTSNRLYAAGDFTFRSGYFRTSSTGVIDTAYGSTSTSLITFTPNTMALTTGGLLYLGGDTRTGQSSSVKIARLTTAGIVDTGFSVGTGFNNTVNKIALDSNSAVYVGGNFTTYNGVAAAGIIKLTTAGAKDTSFNYGTGFVGNGSAKVNALLVHSTGIYVGGWFHTYNGSSITHLVRLTTAGAKDSAWTAPTSTINQEVDAIAIDSSNRLYAAGGFGFVRLTTTGARDSSFVTGAGFNGDVKSITIDSTGKILVVGTFTSYKGIPCDGFIRINTDGSVSN